MKKYLYTQLCSRTFKIKIIFSINDQLQLVHLDNCNVIQVISIYRGYRLLLYDMTCIEKGYIPCFQIHTSTCITYTYIVAETCILMFCLLFLTVDHQHSLYVTCIIYHNLRVTSLSSI